MAYILPQSSQFVGIDISTQSISLSVLEVSHTQSHIIYEQSLAYTESPALTSYGLDTNTKILPNTKEGEAMQPPLLFLEALDLLFEDLNTTIGCKHIKSIAVSAQQHGHVYLGNNAEQSFKQLQLVQESLVEVFNKDSVFSFPFAPIWMMSASQPQADDIRTSIGGSDAMQALSGSDSPARFTGAVIKYIAEHYPNAYEHTQSIALLSSFMSGVLAGRYHSPIDWGNGSGMSLMDYHKKAWSPALARAVSSSQNSQEVLDKLPSLCKATDIIGTIAPYFIEKYQFSEECLICAGSGDNPQSKVVVQGDLLSLGTSFVLMANTAHLPARDTCITGTNAMYDGVNQPFVFACRTNGALVWDRMRQQHTMSFEDCEHILSSTPIGNNPTIWQPLQESFPVSSYFDIHHASNTPQDYAGVIDSTLALLHYYSKALQPHDSTCPLYITGGPCASAGIVQRIADFWNRPIIKIHGAGASLGAACSSYVGYLLHTSNTTEQDIVQEMYTTLIPQVLDSHSSVSPNPSSEVPVRQYESEIIEIFKKITK